MQLLDGVLPLTGRTGYWWDEELYLGLMRLRGVEIRARYAEGFVTGKVALDLGGGKTA